jgi:hypothetical protein
MKSSGAVLRPAYEDIVRILDWAKTHAIELVLVIPPVHARHLEVIWQLGMWPELEAWKHRLASMVSAGRAGQGCALWDFSIYSTLTNEALPSPGGTMRWWRESSHASSAAGAKMLAAMHNEDGMMNAERIGACLVPGNVDRVLADERSAADAWRIANPGDAREIASLRAELGPGGFKTTTVGNPNR